MTQIIITHDHPQFAAVAALLAGQAAPAAAPKSEPTAEEPKPRAARKAKDAEPEKAPVAGDEEANAKAYLEVKRRILALSEKDRDAVVAVLKTYAVTKGSDLTPDQYPAVIKDLDEALADEEEDLS